MAASLAVGLARPDFFLVLPKILVWLVPVWIGVLFLVQILTAPDPTGRAILDAWLDRLGGRKWTCPRCGAEHRRGEPICGECGELAPGVAAAARPWRCAVCEAENEPDAVACSRCTVPRPEAPR